jgi:hypothetical protein
MNKVLLGLFSFAAVLAAPIATSNQSLAQSSTPVSTETIEKWTINTDETLKNANVCATATRRFPARNYYLPACKQNVYLAGQSTFISPSKHHMRSKRPEPSPRARLLTGPQANGATGAAFAGAYPLGLHDFAQPAQPVLKYNVTHRLAQQLHA